MFIVFSIRIVTDVNLNKGNAQRLELATGFCGWSMYLIQYIPDAFYTNLFLLMFHTGLLPYLFKPFIWNVHTNVVEDLCNLQNKVIHVILVSIFVKLYSLAFTYTSNLFPKEYFPALKQKLQTTSCILNQRSSYLSKSESYWDESCGVQNCL